MAPWAWAIWVTRELVVHQICLPNDLGLLDMMILSPISSSSFKGLIIADHSFEFVVCDILIT